MVDAYHNVSFLSYLVSEQETADEMRIRDWSSDVCSADLAAVDMDDVASLVRVGAQLAHDLRIVAVGHEADVLAVRLQGDRQAQFRRDLQIGRASCRERVCRHV